MAKRNAIRPPVAAAVALCLSVFASGCSSSSSTSAIGSTTPTTAGAPATQPNEIGGSTSAPSGCNSTPISAGAHEVEAVAKDASVFGLLFLTHSPPIRDGEEVKIVWRMTGDGDLSVSYESPNNRPGVLTFGPEPHSGSTYTRPGDEWGTGFRFDEPGCWHIHLQRTIGAGDVWLDVARASA